MFSRTKAKQVFYFAALSVLLVFQNCSQDPMNTNGTSGSSATSYQEQLPFAYVSTLDTIAYMSCSEMNNTGYDPRAYFTFRAGAYNTVLGTVKGLGTTQAFQDATKYYSSTSRAQALGQSALNMNTIFNLSIRSTSNYQLIWQTDTLLQGNEVDGFLPSLDTNEIAGPLASLPVGQQLNYFPGAQDQRLVEASLRFLKAEADANTTRNNLGQQSSMLVAAFSNTPDITNPALRSPYNVFLSDGSPAQTSIPAASNMSETNSIYGTGYKMSFSLPAGYSNGDRRVLSTAGIQEINLLNGSSNPATWNCNTNYEFMVVRPEDKNANLVICDATVDTYADATQQAALSAIRRVLRVEDWYVDINHHCVIPKNSGDYCYGSTLGGRSVQYGNIVNGSATCVDSATTVCPHFVSVCIRQ